MAILVNGPHKPPFPFAPNPTTGPEVGPTASVVISPIDTTTLDAKYQDVGAAELSWVDYRIVSRYESDQHVYMMGVTSPGGFQSQNGLPPVSAAFVQLASPTLLWIVEWSAFRSGLPPIIPSPFVFTGLGQGGQLISPWVFMDQILEPVMIRLNPSGAMPMYRINGTYVYGSRRPSAYAHQDVIFPIGPWIVPDNITKVIDDSLLKGGLIDGQQYIPGA